MRDFACDVCDYKAKTAGTLKIHRAIHFRESSRPFKCDQCDGTFRTKLDLKKHSSSVHSDKHQFVCDQCDAAYKYRSELKVHILKHKGEKPHKCDICSQTFLRKEQLRLHKQRIHEKIKKGLTVVSLI